jgi:hypothetical protein
MTSKFPPAAAPPTLPTRFTTNEAVGRLTADKIIDRLHLIINRGHSNGKATDAYNGTYTIFKMAVDPNHDLGGLCMNALAKFATFAALGDPKGKPNPTITNYLTSSRGLPLPKTSGGFRPVCIPNVLMQLVDQIVKLALPISEIIPQLTAAGQYGMTPDGTAISLANVQAEQGTRALPMFLADPSCIPAGQVLYGDFGTLKSATQEIWASMTGDGDQPWLRQNQSQLSIERLYAYFQDHSCFLSDDIIVYIVPDTQNGHGWRLDTQSDTAANSPDYVHFDTRFIHIRIDMENAFNELSRDMVIQAITSNEHMKGFLGYFLTYYIPDSVIALRHAPLNAVGADARNKTETAVITATRGLRQGAVHSSLLYCLATLPCIQRRPHHHRPRHRIHPRLVRQHRHDLQARRSQHQPRQVTRILPTRARRHHQ